MNPRLPIYEYLKDVFNYNKYPLTLLDCKAIIYKATNRRKIWDLHREEGKYLGPEADHYCCHKIFVTKTRAEQIASIVKFYFYKTRTLEVSKLEEILLAVA